MSGAAVIAPPIAERAALEAGQANVLPVGGLRELGRRMARAGHADPLGGLGAEALRGGQGDVLGSAVRLGEDALPQPLGRALDLLDLGG